jgi:hypothetical protein
VALGLKEHDDSLSEPSICNNRTIIRRTNGRCEQQSAGSRTLLSLSVIVFGCYLKHDFTNRLVGWWVDYVVS